MPSNQAFLDYKKKNYGGITVPLKAEPKRVGIVGNSTENWTLGYIQGVLLAHLSHFRPAEAMALLESYDASTQKDQSRSR